MALGNNDLDITLLEKKAGQKAARTLRRNLKNILSTSILATASTRKGAGLMLKLASAGVSMKFDELEAIVIKSSSATFKQHYGFEGIKSNGVAMSMPAKNHFSNLFNNTNALEKLADEIGELRMTKITNKIRF